MIEHYSTVNFIHISPDMSDDILCFLIANRNDMTFMILMKTISFLLQNKYFQNLRLENCMKDRSDTNMKKKAGELFRMVSLKEKVT